jgi:hypothetical protein
MPAIHQRPSLTRLRSLVPLVPLGALLLVGS